MDEVAQIVQGLRIKLPSIDTEQLLALSEPSAHFEQHVAADAGKDFWIFSIESDGLRYLWDGDALVIPASKVIAVLIPDYVETRAQEVLSDTIKAARNFDANTGLQATVEVKGLN